MGKEEPSSRPTLPGATFQLALPCHSLLCFGALRCYISANDSNIDGIGGIVLTHCYCVYLFRHSRMSSSGIDGSGGIGE